MYDLPPAPSPSLSLIFPQAHVFVGKVGNGVEADSVLKNWRHTMGPPQLGLAPEEEVSPFLMHPLIFSHLSL